MNIIPISPIVTRRFIDSIDDRIYRIAGTSVSFSVINDKNSDIQYIMIDIRSSKDDNLICRINISNKDKCDNAFTIDRVNPNNDLFDKPINIGSLYTTEVANRVFKEVQNHTIEWFKIKEDG